MAKNEKAIVQVIAKENDTTAVMKEVHKASDIEENDIISIKLDEENSGEIDEIIMLGKVLAHEVEENSENWFKKLNLLQEKLIIVACKERRGLCHYNTESSSLFCKSKFVNSLKSKEMLSGIPWYFPWTYCFLMLELEFSLLLCSKIQEILF